MRWKSIGRLTYYDIDNIINDIKVLSETLYKQCNLLKRDTESERSIGYSLLEEYFYNLYKHLEQTQPYITNNLNDIPDIELKNNIFSALLSK